MSAPAPRLAPTHGKYMKVIMVCVCVWFRRVNEKLSAYSAAAVNTEIAVFLLS